MIPALAVPLLWRAAGAALAVAALVGLYTWWAGEQRDIGRAEVRAEWDAEKAAQTTAALAQAAKNAEETERRLKAQKEAQDANDRLLADARRDAAGAAAAAGRLRQRIAALAAADRATPGHPAIAGDSPPAGTSSALFADVFSRLDEALRELGAYGDAARAAGEQCQRAYEALTP